MNNARKGSWSNIMLVVNFLENESFGVTAMTFLPDLDD